MLGAIIGDIVGSKFEFTGNKSKNVLFFTKESRMTDDSIMTLAIARTLYECSDDYSDIDRLKETAIYNMKDLFEKYPDTYWGANFYKWLTSDKPVPYNSYGNGSAMRISPVGWVADSIEEVKYLSKTLTEISHNHPEGLKGAEAIAMCIYLARIGKTKEEIEDYVVNNYYPRIKGEDFFTYQKTYGHIDKNDEDSFKEYVTCQGSVPEAIMAFLASISFEDAIRNAMLLGGDSDTIGCMTGSIAEAFYGIDRKMENGVLSYFDDEQYAIFELFNFIKKDRSLK